MPAFRQQKAIVHFALFKNHLGICPGGEAVGVFADRLKGYKTSKGAILFPIGRPVDFMLIADIVKWRAEQVKNGG